MKYTITYTDIDKLPKDIIEQAADPIKLYTIFLLSVQGSGNHEIIQPIGSGTLVSCRSSYGIVTAHHVIASSVYQKAHEIGFVTGTTAHRGKLPKDILSEITVGKPLPLSNRPDLAFIRLPRESIGWLKAEKSFWNLDRWRKRIEEINLPKVAGLWFLLGSPVYSMGIEISGDSPREEIWFPGMAGYSAPPHFFEEDEFDYLELAIEIPGASAAKIDFSGVSGGGIWQVILIDKGHGKISIGECVYRGVAFYQTEIDDEGNRKIICHGLRSIYERLYYAISSI